MDVNGLSIETINVWKCFQIWLLHVDLYFQETKGITYRNHIVLGGGKVKKSRGFIFYDTSSIPKHGGQSYNEKGIIKQK